MSFPNIQAIVLQVKGLLSSVYPKVYATVTSMYQYYSHLVLSLLSHVARDLNTAPDWSLLIHRSLVSSRTRALLDAYETSTLPPSDLTVKGATSSSKTDQYPCFASLIARMYEASLPLSSRCNQHRFCASFVYNHCIPTCRVPCHVLHISKLPYLLILLTRYRYPGNLDTLPGTILGIGECPICILAS